MTEWSARKSGPVGSFKANAVRDGNDDRLRVHLTDWIPRRVTANGFEHGVDLFKLRPERSCFLDIAPSLSVGDQQEPVPFHAIELVPQPRVGHQFHSDFMRLLSTLGNSSKVTEWQCRNALSSLVRCEGDVGVRSNLVLRLTRERLKFARRKITPILKRSSLLQGPGKDRFEPKQLGR